MANLGFSSGMLARPSLTKMVGAAGGPALQGPVTGPGPSGTQPALQLSVPPSAVTPPPQSSPAPTTASGPGLLASAQPRQHPGLAVFLRNHPTLPGIAKFALLAGAMRPGGFLSRANAMGMPNAQTPQLTNPQTFGS